VLTDISGMQIIVVFLSIPCLLGHYILVFPLKSVYLTADFYFLLLEQQKIASAIHLFE